MVNTRTNMAGGPQKCVSFFFELIPKLAYEKNGTTKFHIKTKEHLCWWLQRLLAWNTTLITDSALAYRAMGEEYRPDVTHLDCNHSVGFAAPGPKSQLLNLSNGAVCSNAVEGAHSGSGFGRPPRVSEIGNGVAAEDALGCVWRGFSPGNRLCNCLGCLPMSGPAREPPLFSKARGHAQLKSPCAQPFGRPHAACPEHAQSHSWCWLLRLLV